MSEAVEIAPQIEAGCDSLAWELATAPQANVRDGKKAIAYATQACAMSGWKNGNALDTLAAAYAETGDFPNALKWERAALKVPNQTPSVVADDRKRLGLFEAGQPYHAEN